MTLTLTEEEVQRFISALSNSRFKRESFMEEIVRRHVGDKVADEIYRAFNAGAASLEKPYLGPFAITL